MGQGKTSAYDKGFPGMKAEVKGRHRDIPYKICVLFCSGIQLSLRRSHQLEGDFSWAFSQRGQPY